MVIGVVLLLLGAAQAGWQEDRKADILRARDRLGVEDAVSDEHEPTLRALLSPGPDALSCAWRSEASPGFDRDCQGTTDAVGDETCAAFAATLALAVRLGALSEGEDASIQVTLTCGAASGSPRAVAGVRASRRGSAWHTGAVAVEVTRPPSAGTTFKGSTSVVRAWQPPPDAPRRTAQMSAATYLGYSGIPAYEAMMGVFASLEQDLPAIRATIQAAITTADEVQQAFAEAPAVSGVDDVRAAGEAALQATRDAADFAQAQAAKSEDAAVLSNDLTLRGELLRANVAWVRMADAMASVAARANLPEVPGESLYRHQIRAQTLGRAVDIAEQAYARYLDHLQRRDPAGTGGVYPPRLHAEMRPALERARDAVLVDPDPRVAQLAADAEAYVVLIMTELERLDPAVIAYSKDPATADALRSELEASVARVVAAQKKYQATLNAAAGALKKDAKLR